MFPPGLDPDDPNFLPESTARDSKGVGECACKWELVKGTLTCSPDGKKDHVYVANWRCPATGKEVMTTKYAKASARCKEYKNARGDNQLFFDFEERPNPLLYLLPASMRPWSCG